MRKYKFTVIYSLLAFISVIIILSLGKINTSPEIFLPGYKPGLSFEEIQDPVVKSIVKISKKFGDNFIMYVILKNERTFFNKRDTENVIEIEKQLRALKSIAHVVGAVDLPRGFIKNGYLKDGVLSKDILKNKDASAFISSDGKYLLLNILISKDADPQKALEEVENVLNNWKEYNPIIYGENVIDKALFRELARQMYLYPSIMFALILCVFFYQTRSIRASLFSLITPVFSFLMMIGIFTLLGGELNTLNVMTVSYLMIIGSAYSLHLYNGIALQNDIKEAAKRKMIPILFSMLTTSSGFLSFLFIKIRAFRELGILVSAGLALVFVIIYTSGLEILKPAKKPPRDFKIKYVGDKIALILLISIIILGIISFYAIPKIEIGSDSMSHFKKNSQIRKAYELILREFNQREPVFLMIEKKKGFFLARENKNISNIIEKLEKIKGISKVVYPKNVPLFFLITQYKTTPFLKYFVADPSTIRILIQLDEYGYDNLKKITQKIEEIFKEYNDYDITIAGTVFIWKKISGEIVDNQIKSLTITFIIIYLMVLGIFRKFSLSLVVILPIAVVAMVNFIFMSLFGINLDISTSMIASILVGLVVDYSIHLTYESRITKNPEKALKIVGPAIIGNALGLIVGFSVLMLSPLALFSNVAFLLILGISFGAFATLTVSVFILRKILRGKKNVNNI